LAILGERDSWTISLCKMLEFNQHVSLGLSSSYHQYGQNSCFVDFWTMVFWWFTLEILFQNFRNKLVSNMRETRDKMSTIFSEIGISSPVVPHFSLSHWYYMISNQFHWSVSKLLYFSSVRWQFGGLALFLAKYRHKLRVHIFQTHQNLADCAKHVGLFSFFPRKAHVCFIVQLL
jgi:hypothetical protein